MQPCTMVPPSHWPLDLASHSQVQLWQRLSTPLSSALSFFAWPLLRSLPRTCLVWPLPPASLLVVTPSVQFLVDL